MTSIGISGFAGAGKTEAAKYLQDHHGYTRVHIADPLRDMLRAMLRHYGTISDDMIERYLEGDLKETVIPEVGKSGRQLQISLGTEWGRENVDPDHWATLWHYRTGPLSKPMNDSVRFPNEEQAIHGGGGVTLLIDRPGTGPAAFKWGWLGRLLARFGIYWGVHDSERVDRLKPDIVIFNNGSISDLHRQLDAAIKSINT